MVTYYNTSPLQHNYIHVLNPFFVSFEFSVQRSTAISHGTIIIFIPKDVSYASMHHFLGGGFQTNNGSIVNKKENDSNIQNNQICLSLSLGCCCCYFTLSQRRHDKTSSFLSSSIDSTFQRVCSFLPIIRSSIIIFRFNFFQG